jgi:hypothetical protein
VFPSKFACTCERTILSGRRSCIQDGGSGSHDRTTCTTMSRGPIRVIVSWGGNWFGGSRYGTVDARLNVWTQRGQPAAGTCVAPTCQP